MTIPTKTIFHRFAHYNLFLATLLVSTAANASNNGIPGYSQNETGTSSCHACHTQPFSTSTRTLTITGNTSVLAGAINTYTIKLTTTSGSRGAYGGFDLLASDGTLSPADAETTVLNGELVHSSRKATTYTGASYDVQWNFDWQAPTVSGSTTFFACGLPVNGDSKATKHDMQSDDRTICTTFNILVQQAPVAVAGNNQTVTEGNTVTLDGSTSSDADGSISSYLWEQLSGTTAVISNANTAIASFTAPAVADNTTDELIFRLTVTDNDGLSDTATLSIFDQDVLVSNIAPTANAGTDQSINENTVVSLDATASSDDGSIVAYSWLQTGGFNSVILSDDTSSTPSFIAPLVTASGDTLIFELTVTDDLGVQATDTVSITVNDVDTPPTAIISDASGNVISSIDNNGTVTLYGNFSSDPEGPITAYSWSQTTGDPIVSPGASNTSSFTFTAPDNPGSSIDIQLTVTGDEGSVQDTTTVTLTMVNQPPVVDTGSDQLVNELAAGITLDGSLSVDPNGSISSYLWEQLSGTSVIAFNNTISAIADFTAPDVAANTTEVLVFQLTVTDNYGLTDVGTVNVSVQDALVTNLLPVADAGVNQIVNENTLVTLDASASTDDGSIVSYLWTQIDGVNTITLDDNTSITPSFIAPAVDAGNDDIHMQLTVTDDLGTQSTDTVHIIVNDVDTPPVAKISDASGALLTSINNNLLVTLYGNFSTDVEGPITAYDWSQTAGTAIVNPGVTTSDTFTFTAPDAPDTSIDIQLTVTGDEGSVQDTITATLILINQPPVADAGADQSIDENTLVTLNGSASSDSDGSIAAYAWTQTGGTTVTLTNANTVNPTFTSPEVTISGDTLTFQLITTDNHGAVSAPAPATMMVTVNNVNKAPVANAGTDQSIDENTPAALDGSASSDSDGSIAAYAWTQTGGTGVTLTNANTVNPTFTSPEVAISGDVLTFELVVTDNQGLASTADAISVAVNNVNQMPVANAGSDSSVDENLSFTLDGSASIDDSTVSLYSWTQTGGPSVTLSSSSAIKPSFTAPAVAFAGDTLSFQLSVTDDQGLVSAPATVNITVNNVDNLPVAQITDITGTSITAITNNELVTLYGSFSSDADAPISAYSWSQTAGTAIVSPGASNTSSFSFTAPDDAGNTIGIQLTVTGDGGIQDVVTVTLTLDNLPPMMDAGLDQTVTEGDMIYLTGSVIDPNNNLASVRWRQINCGSDCIMLPVDIVLPLIGGSAITNVLSPAVTPETSGLTLDFELIATDTGGLSSAAITRVSINDNGSTQFPPEAIPFTSSNGRPMAISLQTTDATNTAVISRLQPVDNSIINDNTNRPQSFPYELTDLEVQLSSPGSVLVTLYFPEAIPEGYDAYQYLSSASWINTSKAKNFDDINFDATNGWMEVTEKAEFSADRRSMTFLLTDGGPSDQNPDNLVISVNTGIGQNQPLNLKQPGATGMLSLYSLIAFVFMTLLLRLTRVSKEDVIQD